MNLATGFPGGCATECIVHNFHVWVYSGKEVVTKSSLLFCQSRKCKCIGKNIVYDINRSLKGLSHEIDFKNFDQTLKNLT
jgi:hypothetical protein